MSDRSPHPSSSPAPRRRPARPVKIAYLVSHPIQYQAPLLRRLAREPDLELTVFFGSGFSLRGYRDKGFGVTVEWGVPLLEGYRSVFLSPLHDDGTASVMSPISLGLSRRLADFDVLWTHGYATFNQLHGMLAAKALGIPVLLRAESWLSDRPRGRLRLFAKRACFAVLRHLADGVLPIGTRNAAYWRHYMGPRIPHFLVPYAVDNCYFQRRSTEAAASREALRAELHLDPGRPVILFASKLQERKRCADLIAAYARLAPSAGIDPHPYLVIVGDGQENAALRQQAATTGFQSIRFCGFRNQSELPRFFDLCSVFVLPSRHEPWGLIVNEAMAAGRAVIVSNDVGAQLDLVTDGVEGCVCPVQNVPALHAALVRVLDQPETACQMGARALERIRRWDFEADIRGIRQAVAAVTRLLPGEPV